jgi:tetratricopeptide (TPR) repeat protein
MPGYFLIIKMPHSLIIPVFRNINRIVPVLFFLIFAMRASLFASVYNADYERLHDNSGDSLLNYYNKLNLFFQQYKEKDYSASASTGFAALEISPARYKPLYTKLETALLYICDSTDISDSAKKSISVKLLKLYDMAALNIKERAGYFLARKSFLMETRMDTIDTAVIECYEKALALDWSLDKFYKDRLGMLLMAKAKSNPDYKFKFMELYSRMISENPDDSLAAIRISAFADNPGRIVETIKGEWRSDKSDEKKGWLYAITASKLGMYPEAIEALEYLVEKHSDSLKYLLCLSDSYTRKKMWDKAAETYNKVLFLDPKNKTGLIGVGNVYRAKRDFIKARAAYQIAATDYPKWGIPVFLEGELYEQSAAECGGKEFIDKLAYVLAIEVFLRSKNIDASMNGKVQDKLRTLSKFVPGRDEFMKKKKQYPAGSKVLLVGDCYRWMEKYVTIPIF